jgi:hypothetical protein
MLTQMLGSFAEFEREMIRARRAGLQQARAQGYILGRKPEITAEQEKAIIEAVSSGRNTAAPKSPACSKFIAQPSRASSLRRALGLSPPQIHSVGFWEDSAMIPSSSQKPTLVTGVERPRRVDSGCGAVALGRSYLLPPLSSGSA